MSYIIDQTKLNAKNTITESIRQEINQIEYQAIIFEQTLLSLVTSYFDNGVSSTGDQAFLELEQVKERLLQITNDLVVAVNFAEKLDVMTWVEDVNDGQPNSGYY